MVFKLDSYQEDALGKLFSGAILFGGVGSGKTVTGLEFYKRKYKHLKLFVITTAKKRDTKDFEDEAKLVGINDLVVDSWNNIEKYKHEKGFFIFDEQRVVGYGRWAKTFIHIAHRNPWILMSATPGDTWMDYVPVFIANRFYKNKTDFINQHVEYDRYVRFPRVKRYHNEGRLLKLRESILVPMPVKRHTTRIRKFIECNYNKELYDITMSQRMNPYSLTPIENASELTQTIRRIVSEDPHRMWKAKWLMDIHDRIVVFYNYNYELDILRNLSEQTGKPYAEWNGQKHEEIPDTDKWIYLVQYTAGAEGWNCTTTNVMLFYSLNYSYRIVEQAEGRIDRRNTPYEKLEYFYLTSKSRIDSSVRRAVTNKKSFSESGWAKRSGFQS